MKEGCKNPPKFHQLDIGNEESIERFRDYIKGLNVLLNNAAIDTYKYKRQCTAPFAEQVENTIRINFIGTLNVCRLLFPLLNLHARVVHVTPMAGGIHLIPSESLRNEFRKPDLMHLSMLGRRGGRRGKGAGFDIQTKFCVKFPTPGIQVLVKSIVPRGN